MKIGSELQFEVPDACPGDCSRSPKMTGHGFYQGCACTRCPVFNCQPPKTEEDAYYMPLVKPEDYRDDWAEEWVKFFNSIR